MGATTVAGMGARRSLLRAGRPNLRSANWDVPATVGASAGFEFSAAAPASGIESCDHLLLAPGWRHRSIWRGTHVGWNHPAAGRQPGHSPERIVRARHIWRDHPCAGALQPNPVRRNRRACLSLLLALRTDFWLSLDFAHRFLLPVFMAAPSCG